MRRHNSILGDWLYAWSLRPLECAVKAIFWGSVIWAVLYALGLTNAAAALLAEYVRGHASIG